MNSSFLYRNVSRLWCCQSIIAAQSRGYANLRSKSIKRSRLLSPNVRSEESKLRSRPRRVKDHAVSSSRTREPVARSKDSGLFSGPITSSRDSKYLESKSKSSSFRTKSGSTRSKVHSGRGQDLSFRNKSPSFRESSSTRTKSPLHGKAKPFTAHHKASTADPSPGPPNSGQFASLRTVTLQDRKKNQTALEKINSFAALRLQPIVRQAITDQLLSSLPEIKPTSIQTLGIRALRNRAVGKDSHKLKVFLLAAETGSGKTLAYLAPLMSDLKEQEDSEIWKNLQDIAIVRSIILVPSHELISQVISTVKSMSHLVKLSSFACKHDISPKAIADNLSNRRIDILVCTPDKFESLVKHKQLTRAHLKYCHHLVVDEADSLMDDKFIPSTHKVIETIPNLEKLIFCSATIPRKFDAMMRKLFPQAIRVVTPNLHKVPRHIDFRVIQVFNPPYLNSKSLALQQALYAIYHDNTEQGVTKRVVVFVNNRQSIEGIVDSLREKGYDAVGISGGLTAAERDLLEDNVLKDARTLDSSASQDEKLKVIITTDLLARGVDMKNVRNIILYDLPYSSVDLLHRAGRTGRMGKRGRVFLFVDKKESRGWVKGLERVVRQGMTLA